MKIFICKHCGHPKLLHDHLGCGKFINGHLCQCLLTPAEIEKHELEDSKKENGKNEITDYLR